MSVLVIHNVDPFCGGTRRSAPVFIIFAQDLVWVGVLGLLISHFMSFWAIQDVDLLVKQVLKGVS